MAAGDRTIALKLADTSRSSTTTLTADPDLVVALSASTTYIIEMTYRCTASGNEALVHDFSHPAATRDFQSEFYGTFRLSSNDTQFINIPTSGGSNAVSLATNIDTVQSLVSGTAHVHLTGLITTSAAGNLTFRWAQRISTGTSTVLYAGASLIVTEV